MYLIKLLQHKGMPQRQLSVVVSRILYVLPAWGGFLGAELIGRINAFFRRVKRFGYIDTVLTVDELLWQSEYDLSVKTSIPGHYLHHLLPPYRRSILRERGHSFHLPDYDTVLFKRSFIVRSLYKFVAFCILFLYVLFCVFPVCYDVRLSHLNKDYLLTYL